jgi:hypothetical protein
MIEEAAFGYPRPADNFIDRQGIDRPLGQQVKPGFD